MRACLLRRWWSPCPCKEGWWGAWILLQSLGWIVNRSRRARESSLNLLRYLVEEGSGWLLSWPYPLLTICPRWCARALLSLVPWSGISPSRVPIVSWRIPPVSLSGEQENFRSHFQRRRNRPWRFLRCRQESHASLKGRGGVAQFEWHASEGKGAKRTSERGLLLIVGVDSNLIVARISVEKAEVVWSCQ